jgi:hypothetical protein
MRMLLIAFSCLSACSQPARRRRPVDEDDPFKPPSSDRANPNGSMLSTKLPSRAGALPRLARGGTSSTSRRVLDTRARSASKPVTSPAIRGCSHHRIAHERIRFVDVVEGTLRMRIVEAGRPDRVRASFEVPRAIADGIAADPEWRTRLPALFEHGFVSIDRYLR